MRTAIIAAVAFIAGCQERAAMQPNKGVYVNSEIVFRAASWDGRFLLMACETSASSFRGELLASREELSLAALCAGYVYGFFDGMSTTAAVLQVHEPMCFPKDDYTIDQTIRVIVKYLRENPETLNESAGVLTLRALSKAFPCK